MTYYGDYAQFLAWKKKYYWAFGLPSPNCTAFAALNQNGDPLLGYNSDGEHRPLLLLYTASSNAYASVSIVDIGEDLGFDAEHTPFDSDRTRSLLLYSPYFANTGMNEMGLAFGVIADSEGRSSIDPDKETTFPSEIRRYILDDARDVVEAIVILSKYNIRYDKIASRILLADRSGHSAIVEWVDGNMQVSHNETLWQAATNIRVYDAQDEIARYVSEYQMSGGIAEDINGRSYWRYITTSNILEQATGRLTIQEGMDLLNEVSLTVSEDVWWPTQYSVVYDLTSGAIQVATDRNFTQVYQFQLKMASHP